MLDHTLANVILDAPDRLAGSEGLYYLAQAPCAYDAAEGGLSFAGEVDFTTYFNALSLRKWRRYTVAGDFFLSLELSGAACALEWRAAGEDGTARTVGGPVRIEAAAEPRSVRLAVPACDEVLLGFRLVPEGRALLRSARYEASVREEDVRAVELALCTTTFKKERFVTRNVESVKREVLGSDDPVAGHFHMHVVDNGRTLDPDALAGDGVSVHPNDNVGGSGGFARGMLEALASSPPATHVLLMDDDVVVSPESFKRVFNLLSLARDEYADAFVEGAMLTLEDPAHQFEDVSYVRSDGVYARVKPDLRVDELADAAKNETIDVEVANAYGAWWFCCIPASAIREHGLPLPLFIRCDDVEFGVRCRPTFMTMNGICVWHEGFDGRFRASVDCYHYVRNYLVMIAMSEGRAGSERLFLMRAERNLRIYLRMMAYEAAELLLDGWEDYLKGPAFLAEASGEAVMREKGAKNERLVPLGELPADATEGLVVNRDELGREAESPLPLKLWRTLPYDRHRLPDALLRDKPASVYYSECTSLSLRSMGRRTLVALDKDGRNGAVRRLDRARYRAIRQRWARLRAEQERRGEDVAAAYRAARPRLTSEEFWRGRLGL